MQAISTDFIGKTYIMPNEAITITINQTQTGKLQCSCSNSFGMFVMSKSKFDLTTTKTRQYIVFRLHTGLDGRI